MLLKTKLLLTLGGLGVAGGTSAGVYYLNSESSGDQDKQELKTPVGENVDRALPTAGSDGDVDGTRETPPEGKPPA